MTTVQPFEVHIPQDALDDLYLRLSRARWPPTGPSTGWAYGASGTYLRDLVGYWQSGYDWRLQEARINALPNFRTDIDGLGVHFIHARGKGPNPMPLLLVHGYPGTPFEYFDLISRLTDPVAHGGDATDAFDVVAPTIPGHGFSDLPNRAGFEDRMVGDMFTTLMEMLGYERFGVHAYDIGASISGYICFDHPDQVIGYHSANPGNPGPELGPDSPPLSENEQQYLALRQEWHSAEGAYAHILATKHHALAYGLNDSPVGLAAWILDKWFAWTSPPTGNLDDHFSRDDLLTIIMTYWFTESIDAANHYYAELPPALGTEATIEVPMGGVLATNDPANCPPREYVERLYTDVRHWVEIPGGHFASAEQPELMAESIRTFFRPLREYS